MTGFAKIALAVVAIHLFESTLLFLGGPILSRIEPMLLYVAFAAFRRPAGEGALLGLGVGLFRDVAGFGTPGPELLAVGAAGAFAGWAHRKLVGESTPGLLLILFGSVAIHDLIRYAVLVPHGLLPIAARLLLETVPAGLLTALTGLALRHLARLLRPRARVPA